jgi:hypothetical protein
MEKDDRMRSAGSREENMRYIEAQYQQDVDAVKTETKRSVRDLDSKMLKKKTVSPGKE